MKDMVRSLSSILKDLVELIFAFIGMLANSGLLN